MNFRNDQVPVIPKSELQDGCFYLGHPKSRYPVAYWESGEFVSIDTKFDKIVLKHMNHWDDGPPFGCFAPIQVLDHREVL